MAEKTEKATPKKLRDARKKGQVAKSQDFPSAFTFITSIFLTLIFAKTIYQKLSNYMIQIFNSISEDQHLQTTAGGHLTMAMEIILNSSLPIMIGVASMGVLVNFLIIGPMFASEALKPDIKRLNPVNNIKNIFKLKTLIELLKSIFKLTCAFILIYAVIYNSLQEIAATCGQPVIISVMVFASFLKKVLLFIGIFFIAIAIFDLIFQKRVFAKEMRMEKFEVKQEIKDTEGDPHLKSKRRRTAQEIAYQEGPSATRRAKTVITNPTHIAVAIEYYPNEEPAPIIATMGIGAIAEQIIAIAMENNIPIMRNVELARILYNIASIGDYIPETTYQAVAEILKWAAALEQQQEEKSIFEFLDNES